MQLSIHHVAIHHIAMRTPDIERLERFYVAILGLRVVRRDAGRGSVWLALDAAILMLERANGAEPSVPPGSGELVAFAIHDKEPWRARLAEAAIAIEAESAHTLYFRDPDGRRTGLTTFPPLRAP